MLNVSPLGLQRMAGAIAKDYGDKGAIIITFGSEGIRIGTEHLTPDELRQALCTAIHYSFTFEDDA